MDIPTLAAARQYTKDTVMGAGAIKGEKGDKGDKGDPGIAGTNGADGKDGLSIKAISIKQDNTGKIIDATATLSDNSTLKVDITTINSGESGFDSVEF